MADETSPGNRRHGQARTGGRAAAARRGHEVRVVSRRARPAGEARAFTSMRFDLRQA